MNEHSVSVNPHIHKN